MEFEVHLAAFSDIPAFVTCHISAFAQDAIFGPLDANVDPDVKRENSEERYRQAFNTSHLTGARFWKAVESATGTIIGVARWNYPVTLTPSQAAEKASIPPPTWPPGTNLTLVHEVFAKLGTQRPQHLDTTHDYYMQVLGVLPSHRGRGVGTALLRRGLEAANAAGARCYVEASPVALPLYLKLGWEVANEMVWDLERFGIGEGLYVVKILVRSPHVVEMKNARASVVAAATEATGSCPP